MNFQELIAAYEVADAHWLQKKVELEQATGARSDVVKQIAELVAPKKKIPYKGGIVVIVARHHEGGITYYLKGKPDGEDVFSPEAT